MPEMTKPRHSKRYNQYGDGVGLYCGEHLIADNPYRGANFSVSDCSHCGMEVVTIGCSPDTDKVHERR